MAGVKMFSEICLERFGTEAAVLIVNEKTELIALVDEKRGFRSYVVDPGTCDFKIGSKIKFTGGLNGIEEGTLAAVGSYAKMRETLRESSGSFRDQYATRKSIDSVIQESKKEEELSGRGSLSQADRLKAIRESAAKDQEIVTRGIERVRQEEGASWNKMFVQGQYDHAYSDDLCEIRVLRVTPDESTNKCD